MKNDPNRDLYTEHIYQNVVEYSVALSESSEENSDSQG